MREAPPRSAKRSVPTRDNAAESLRQEGVRRAANQFKTGRRIENEIIYAVIKEAENIRQCKLFFEDKGVEQESEPEEFRDCSYDYWTLRDEIRDESLTLEERGNAVSELETLAKTGDKHAQYLMGKLWRDGPLLTPNSSNARYWFQQAAEQGHSYAQYALGKLLLSDDVEVRDPEQGMRWLETAAQNGNDYAAYRLGKEYYRGKKVERSFTAAAKWFDRAAQVGNQYAQYMLGKLYLMGQGVEYDKKMGIHWLSSPQRRVTSTPTYSSNSRTAADLPMCSWASPVCSITWAGSSGNIPCRSPTPAASRSTARDWNSFRKNAKPTV